MDSINNNTFIPLIAGGIWEGKSESISKFNVAMVSCISDTSGSLQLYFSQNNIDFDFVKQYEPKPGQPFVINQKVEAKWFKAKFTNISNVNQTYLRLTTTYKDDIRSDLDIRPLNEDKDTIGIPALDAIIKNGKLNVNVEGITVSDISVDINGQTVDIEGQIVKSQIYDYNNYAITSQVVGSKRGLDVNNIGTTKAFEGTSVKEIGAYTDIHNNVNLLVYDDALNDKVNNVDTIGEDTGSIKVYVSNSDNNKVKCDVSGQRMDISGQRVDISGQWVHSKIYGSSDGVDYHHIKTNNNGVVSTNAVIQDKNGDDFTSHLENGFRGLDTYVLNKVDISGNAYNQDKLKVDVSGQYMNVSNNVQVINGDTNFQTNTYLVNDNGNVADVVKNDVYTLGMLCVLPCSNAGLPYSEFNPMYTMMKAKEPGGANVNLTLTEIDTNIKALDVNVANTSPLNVAMNTNSSFKVDISGVGLSGDKLKVDVSGQRIDISGQTVILGGFDGGVNSNITNSVLKVDVSGVGVSGDKLKVDISGQNTLMTAFYRTGTTNSNLTSIQPYGTANVKALETYSYMVGLNNEISVPLQITSTTGVSTQSLDVQIQNESKTITYPNFSSNNITNGLNIYQIMPKVQSYSLRGSESGTNNYRIMGNSSNTSYITSGTLTIYNFGINNLRTFYGGLSAGLANRTVLIDYVDSNGDLQTVQKVLTPSSLTTALVTNVIGINRVYFDSSVASNQTLLSGSLVISPNTSGTLSFTGKNSTYDVQGYYTCPNNKIAMVKNFYITSTDSTGANSGSTWIAFVSDKQGNRRSALTLGHTIGNRVLTDVNIVLYPGDTVYVGVNFVGTTFYFEYDAVVLQYDL